MRMRRPGRAQDGHQIAQHGPKKAHDQKTNARAHAYAHRQGTRPMHLRMRVRIHRSPTGAPAHVSAHGAPYCRPTAPGPKSTPVGERVFGVFGPKCVDVASFRPRAPRPPIKLRFSYYGSRANADAVREHAAWAAAGTAADS